MRYRVTFLIMIVSLCNYGVHAQNRTIPGRVETPYSTLENIAIDWFIDGDANENGTVTVQFREAGKSEWRRAMPLRRIPAGANNTTIGLERKIDGYTGFKWPNRHSGSIFNLNPNTLYEIHLQLSDPDGGAATKILKVKTRRVPEVTSHSRIIEVPVGNHDTLHTVDGTPDNIAVYRCSNGKAVFKCIDARNRKWIFIQGLYVDNDAAGGIGIDMAGCENCAVTNNTVHAESGIVGFRPGITNCYISDNKIDGLYEWKSEIFGANGNTSGEGIQITGPGNVICYNKVQGFRDCISFMEDEYAENQVCDDIYNNDIYRGLDDGIEADFSFSNCRVYNNRMTNCFVGLSSQPGLGGPTYFIRNVMYNVLHSGFKLKRHSVGDVVLHNTLIKTGVGLGGNSPMDYAFFRNNLVIAGPTKGIMWGGYSSGNAYAADVIDPGAHSSFDYDAVGVYDTAYASRIGGRLFADVEPHGVQNITMAETFNGVPFPGIPTKEYLAPDLRLQIRSRAIDAAAVIPNINDGFTGKAPDCGAYEIGRPVPHYGPR